MKEKTFKFDNKLISVVVPTYNTGRLFLNDCIRSLVEQTYKNIEIIIVDGYSTDETYACAEEWAGKDRRVQVIQSEKGASKQRNLGIECAKGDFVAFIDSDDYISPNYFESMLSLMSEETDICIPKIVYVTFDGENNTIDKVSDCNVPDWLVTNDNFFIDFQQNGLVNPVKLYRREIIGNNRFRTDLNYGEDLFFNYSLAQKGFRCIYVTEAFYYYRRIKGSNSGIKRLNGNSIKIISVLFKLSKKYKRGNKENYQGVYQEFCNDFKLFYYACVKNNKTRFIIKLFKYRIEYLKIHHSFSEIMYLLFPYTYKFLKKIKGKRKKID